MASFIVGYLFGLLVALLIDFIVHRKSRKAAFVQAAMQRRIFEEHSEKFKQEQEGDFVKRHTNKEWTRDL